jgi:hypothetical protein
MDIQIAKGESVILLITPIDTRGQGWLLAAEGKKVILTIRETEQAPALLSLLGCVEYTGQNVDDPAKLAVKLETLDTYKLPIGEYWYDITMIQQGNWYDINEYNGLYAKVDYGRVRDDNGNWIDVEEGWVELTDNTTNYLQVTKDGKYLITETDFEKEGDKYKNFNLYKIITLNGQIIDKYPFDNWFAEGGHTGLTFAYQAGKVVDDEFLLQDIEAGTIALKPSIPNYIEVTPAGDIESNITRFTNGSYPLYIAKTSDTGIIEVTRQSKRLIFDNRGQFVRGDSYIPCVKAKASIIWTSTQVTDDNNDEGEQD